ncbi:MULTISPECIES: hypothetical protein [Listeria]|uniref:hypothetical protein n=1 Tax=Listeria TaxID=1637 RepID=UPI000B58A6BE|nr:MULTISPECIES: hypothetical protein [Listeria]
MKIYILLTSTNTLLARTIQKSTGFPFSHVSLALDASLFNTYSFGRKSDLNPFQAGFVRENMHEPIFQNATCIIYELQVSKEKYAQIKRSIHKMKRREKLYRYNFLGLFALLFQIPYKRENHMFCSQFVGQTLLEADIKIDNIPPELLKPSDFTAFEPLNEVFSGQLKDYPIFEKDNKIA